MSTSTGKPVVTAIKISSTVILSVILLMTVYTLRESFYIRLIAIRDYGRVIHEFDPYFVSSSVILYSLYISFTFYILILIYLFRTFEQRNIYMNTAPKHSLPGLIINHGIHSVDQSEQPFTPGCNSQPSLLKNTFLMI